MMDISPEEVITDDKFHQLFAKTDVIAVQGYDHNRNIIYWNVASEKLYGFSQREAIGKKIDDLIIPRNMVFDFKKQHKTWMINEKPIPSSELVLKHQNGDSVNVFSSYVKFNSDEQNCEIYKIDIDIAKQKRIESLVQYDEALINSIFETLPDLFFLIDADGTIRDFHESEKSSLYTSPSKFLGKRVKDILPDSVALIFDENKTVTLETGEVTTYEYQLDFPQGKKDFEARLARLPDGKLLIAIVRDITEQKLAEDAVRNRDNIPP